MVGYDPRYRIAVIIPNYNMPEAADAIVGRIRASSDERMYDLFLVDNGSDLVAPAKNTTVLLPTNCQTTGAILCGMAAADRHVRENKLKHDYFAYWIIITSTTLLDRIDYISEGLLGLAGNVGYMPALTIKSTSAWKHLFRRNVNSAALIKHLSKYSEIIDNNWAIPRSTRKVWMLDNIATFWRKDWLDSIGRFDPKLTYAWGIDLETSYLARKQGKYMVVSDWVNVTKTTDIGYSMGRMNMSADDRRTKAYSNMKEILSQRYGPDWEYKMRNENVKEEWR